jgi:hypothetical protein
MGAAWLAMPVPSCGGFAHFIALSSSVGIDDDAAQSLLEMKASEDLAETAKAMMRMAATRLTLAQHGVPWNVTMRRGP